MSLKISDEEINAAFKDTNFGTSDFRALLAKSTFKRLVGYHCGHTITMIMRELKLITQNDNVTVRGKLFLREEYATLLSSGG